MSIEAGLILAAKWGLAGVGGYILYIAKIAHAKISNTYTKEETEQLIDLKLEPVQVQFNHLDTQMDTMNTLLQQISIDNREARERSDERDERIKEDVSEIKTTVAVLAAKTN